MRLSILCAALILSFSVQALPTDPVLRIEPGEHTLKITGMAADKSGRYLVTVSEDKTARVWDTSNGKPLYVFRPPVDEGPAGNLYAVTVSPDGTTVAVGGMPADERGIYLFELSTGRLLRSLPVEALTQVAQLAYSPDGKTLAVLLGEMFDSKLCLISAESGKVIDKCDSHTENNKDTFVDFAADGKLVKLSADGLLRLYHFDGKHLKLLGKQTAKGGKNPLSARISPDGKHIAVNFADTTAVSVLDASNLNFEYAADTQGVNGVLQQLLWSADSGTLYAGGDANQDVEGKKRRYIRIWPNAGSGVASNRLTDSANITSLAAVQNGGVAFGTLASSWGEFNAANKVLSYHSRAIVGFAGSAGKLDLTGNGKAVRVNYGSASSAVFDTVSRSFLPQDAPAMIAPKLTAPGIEITDWRNSKNTKLNGKKVQLVGDKTTRNLVGDSSELSDISRSLALLPGEDGFVLGTDHSLRSYDDTGEERWVNDAVPGQVWDVNASSDGRWIIAAYADGTIRWHRAKDGVELLALLPHPDKKRWVMWTPQGYYDASGSDAEELIGWHMNRGENAAAAFYPVSRLKRELYRPEVIQEVLNSAAPPPSKDIAASLKSLGASQ